MQARTRTLRPRAGRSRTPGSRQRACTEPDGLQASWSIGQLCAVHDCCRSATLGAVPVLQSWVTQTAVCCSDEVSYCLPHCGSLDSCITLSHEPLSDVKKLLHLQMQAQSMLSTLFSHSLSMCSAAGVGGAPGVPSASEHIGFSKLCIGTSAGIDCCLASQDTPWSCKHCDTHMVYKASREQICSRILRTKHVQDSTQLPVAGFVNPALLAGEQTL